MIAVDFLSSSLDSLFKTLVDKSHKTLKNLKEGFDDNGEILNIVKEIGEENKTVKDLKKDYPDKIENLEEALLNYIGEKDLKILKTEISDNIWKYLNKKLAHPNEYLNCPDVYQFSVDNLEKEDFFSKLKIDYPSDEEIERTKETIKLFDFKNGEELTQLYLKSDVILLTYVFEKFIKVSTNEFDINPP